MGLFDSVNAYKMLEVISDRTPQGLVNKIKSIDAPLKILSIGQFGISQVAYVLIDAKIIEKKNSPLKEKKDG